MTLKEHTLKWSLVQANVATHDQVLGMSHLDAMKVGSGYAKTVLSETFDTIQSLSVDQIRGVLEAIVMVSLCGQGTLTNLNGSTLSLVDIVQFLASDTELSKDHLAAWSKRLKE